MMFNTVKHHRITATHTHTRPPTSACGTSGAEEFVDPERRAGAEKMDVWMDELVSDPVRVRG